MPRDRLAKVICSWRTNQLCNYSRDQKSSWLKSSADLVLPVAALLPALKDHQLRGGRETMLL